jgi:phosphohistidine phosphatase
VSGKTRRRLYLLRHAKSSWKQAELPDHERPLAGRGRRAAQAMARHLDQRGIAPELVLCSTARRARETFERIEPALGGADVRYEPGLYGATADALLERLHGVPNRMGEVMLIGHNPALEQLARELARPSRARAELEQKFPTAALATLEFAAASWRELSRDGAALISVVRPRDLES